MEPKISLEELELFKSTFGTDKVDEVVKIKSTQKQTRESLIRVAPSTVNISKNEARRLTEKAGIEFLDGYESRVISYQITNESVDRFGDIVRMRGLDLTEFLTNSVVMLFHNYQGFPVGNAIKIDKIQESKSITSLALFADERVDTSGMADLTFKFVKSGFLKGVSIGFIPKKTNRPNDPKERDKLGLGTFGVEFLKSLLLEYSPTGIPANPTALTNMIKNMLKDFGDIKSIFSIFNNEDVEKIEKLKFFEDLNLMDMFIEHIKGNVRKEIIFPSIIIPDSEDKSTEDDNEEKDVELKPFPNEHAARLKNPKDFDPDTFRRTKGGTIFGSKKVPTTISIIWGKLKGAAAPEDFPIPQSLRFPTKDWTVDQAKTWLKDNNIKFILFEKATGEEKDKHDDDEDDKKKPKKPKKDEDSVHDDDDKKKPKKPKKDIENNEDEMLCVNCDAILKDNSEKEIDCPECNAKNINTKFESVIPNIIPNVTENNITNNYSLDEKTIEKIDNIEKKLEPLQAMEKKLDNLNKVIDMIVIKLKDLPDSEKQSSEDTDDDDLHPADKLFEIHPEF